MYAPEPFDVGRILQVDITTEGQMITLTTTGPIDPGPVLSSLSIYAIYLLYSVF